jgi:subtilisin family serine protease
LRFLHITLLLLFSAQLFAQTANFKSFMQETAYRQSQTERIGVLTGLSKLSGHSTLLVVLERIPTTFEKNEFVQNGITFTDYIPHNSWLTVVQGNGHFLLNSGLVKALYPLRPEMKLSEALQTGEIPSHAIEGERVLLDVSVFGEFSVDIVNAELIKLDGVVKRIDKRANWWVVSLHKHQIAELSKLPFVSYAAPVLPMGEPENYTARSNHRINAMQHPNASYDGEGVDVMLQDDGPIGPHVDYTGRIGASYPTINRGDHGDHVAGTIMGAGNRNPLARGMAPAAELYVYGAAYEAYPGFDSIYNHYHTHNIRITSTSYSDGCNAGYTALSRKLDLQVAQFKDLIHVFSAGNSGNSNCGYGATGYGNITGGHKVAKNAVVVANLNAQDTLSASSSRGPTKDGRLKPDISAVGTNVYSTTNPDNYTTKSGTSMSCPGVSGTMATLLQAFTEIQGRRPATALLKNILLNAADDLGNPGPDYNFGFGRMNARKSLMIIEENLFDSVLIANNQSDTIVLNIPSGVEVMRIMLTWDDPAAATSAQLALVNDLDLKVNDQMQFLHLPLVLNPQPSAVHLPATPGKDSHNNAEQVTIQNPAGGSYELIIKGNSVPAGPQRAYLTYVYELTTPVFTYPNGGESFVPGEKELLRWDSPDMASTSTLEFSVDSGQTWQILANVNPGMRSYEWTVPQVLTGEAMIKVIVGAGSDASDYVFNIIRNPNVVNVQRACVDSMVLGWSAVAGAEEYTVYMLGPKYMDSVATTTSNSWVFKNNYNPYREYWFAISAHNRTQQVNSRRSLAFRKAPGLITCQPTNDFALHQFDNDVSGQHGCSSNNKLLIGVEVLNNGATQLSGFTIYSSLAGAAPVSEAFSGTLAIGRDTVVYLSNTPAVPFGKEMLKVWIQHSSDENPYNDTLSSFVYPINTPLVDTPLVQTFDQMPRCGVAFDCGNTNCQIMDGWYNSRNGEGDDIDWRVHYGLTASSNTGPTGDHTSQQGHYIYLEATECFGSEAQLTSPCLDLRSTLRPGVNFWYHMFGSDMGELHIDILVDGRWINDVVPVLKGINNNVWQEQVIDLAPFKEKVINLRFRGITGGGYRSDMAIDDISFNFERDYTYDQNVYAPKHQILIPNPAKDACRIYGLNINGENLIRLKELGGRVIWEVSVGKETAEIPLHNLSTGIYLVEIIGQGYREVHKLVKH